MRAEPHLGFVEILKIPDFCNMQYLSFRDDMLFVFVKPFRVGKCAQHLCEKSCRPDLFGYFFRNLNFVKNAQCVQDLFVEEVVILRAVAND